MLRNYIIIVFRKFTRQKLFVLINTLGLTIGILCFVLAFLYVKNELSYEDFHVKKDRVYRLTMHRKTADYDTHWARINQDWAIKLKDDLPEIEHLVRFQDFYPRNIRIGDKIFKQEFAFSADPEVLEVFSFELEEGDIRTALDKPESIIITREMAQKYFGDENPMGKNIEIAPQDQDFFLPYTVTGIMKDLPATTHLPVNMLVPIKPEERKWWAYTYLLVKPGIDPLLLDQKIQDFIRQNCGDSENCKELKFPLQPLASIHLNSNLAREITPNRDSFTISMISVIGIFVLMVAIINYMNLSSARSLERAREVGIRKVLGSQKHQLIGYFLTESIVFTFIAGLLSFGLIYYFLPFFNHLTGIQLVFKPIPTIQILLLITAVTGLLAGLYPAFIQSSFQPVRVLKGSSGVSIASSGRKINLRKVLVSFQFAISLTLLICTLITFDQFNYLQKKKLGFEKDQILAVPNIPSGAKWNLKSFREELSSNPEVVAVSACMEPPSREIRDSGPVTMTGYEKTPNVDIQVIDIEFIEFMDVEILAGSSFSEKINDDIPAPEIESFEDYERYIEGNRRAYLINESAMTKLGIVDPKEAVGKEVKFSIGGLDLQKGPIVGVVKDFHHESLKNEIDPLIMVYEPIWLNTILIKIRPENTTAILQQIEAQWEKSYPALPFDYSFLDELFAQLYTSERQQFQIMLVFSCLAIFVAFLGVFGLVAHSVKNRMREIAVRKVLGASVHSIILLFSKDFVYLIIPAMLIALPASWYYMSDWLENFAYRINISPLSFLVGFCFLMLVLGVTIFLQVRKTASKNPVEALKFE